MVRVVSLAGTAVPSAVFCLRDGRVREAVERRTDSLHHLRDVRFYVGGAHPGGYYGFGEGY